MKTMNRITMNTNVMGGKACIRGMRLTVSMILGLISAGRTKAEILSEYPYLESEDIDQALIYAAWRLEEQEEPILLSSH